MGRRRRGARGVDKISSLPDAVLSRILSLIPTKEAVATSILSKRWTHLWKFVDSIDFPGIVKVNDVDSNHKFNEFVDSVLVSRDTAGSHFIKTFRLDIVYIDTHLASLGFPNITKWVNLVVQRGLEHLYLHLHAINRDDEDDDDEEEEEEEEEEEDENENENEDPKLPISILTCRTLVSLDLLGFRVEGFSFSSIGFGFPSLKTLNLRFIVFPEDRDFMLLLAGCPNLEHLRAYLEIQSSSILTYSPTGSLTLHQEFKSLSLPKLISADITQCECYFPLKALSNSEHLCVDPINLYTLGLKFLQGDLPQHPYDKIPTFHNLTHLELHDCWDLVARVLQYFPKLENLKLYQDSYGSIENEEAEKWVDLEFVPECLLSSLRTCTMQDFSGLQGELVLAKYILENAKNLKTMIIWCKSKSSKIQRKLSACLKASATCQLSVYIGRTSHQSTLNSSFPYQSFNSTKFNTCVRSLGATRVLVQLKSTISCDSSHELLDANVLGFFGTKSIRTCNTQLENPGLQKQLSLS